MRLEGIFIFSCQCGNSIKTTSTPPTTHYTVHCPKSNLNFRDITPHVEENEIQHEIFRLESRFPRYISCYISENRLPLGQCTLHNAPHSCNTLYELIQAQWGSRAGIFLLHSPLWGGPLPPPVPAILNYTYQQSSQSELFWVFIILVLFKGSSCK